jgi:hypothetical protein
LKIEGELEWRKVRSVEIQLDRRQSNLAGGRKVL